MDCVKCKITREFLPIDKREYFTINGIIYCEDCCDAKEEFDISSSSLRDYYNPACTRCKRNVRKEYPRYALCETCWNESREKYKRENDNIFASFNIGYIAPSPNIGRDGKIIRTAEQAFNEDMHALYHKSSHS